MTTRQKLELKGINWNTLLLIIGILGALYTTIKLGGPILNMGTTIEKVEGRIASISTDMQNMRETQAVQTSVLKTLADVAKDSSTLRIDFETTKADTASERREHTRQLEAINRRLERLEQRP